MNEAEWLACTDPMPMLRFMRGKATDRKLRLFACASLRHVFHLVTAPARRQAVEIAEQLADGIVAVERRQAFTLQPDWPYNSTTAKIACDSPGQEAANRTAAAVLWANAQTAAETVAWNVPKLVDAIRVQIEQAACSSLVREIFGPIPFRPVTCDANWLTPTVISRARAIYSHGAFDRLPLLANALEEAGCKDPDILTHCVQDGEHVRGCWVVDLTLGNE